MFLSEKEKDEDLLAKSVLPSACQVVGGNELKEKVWPKTVRSALTLDRHTEMFSLGVVRPRSYSCTQRYGAANDSKKRFPFSQCSQSFLLPVHF
ncbi:hypothetical protein AVEN_122188-1 [Araneus ventricosus]|uniref:Uncharacterized protein n=1 Tax=Araneus ventricosus TaxID=182803 RepID=A0A4Y2IGE1_ARAVE|nr:hypothetical protein AVEN_122188-1 [Araneus ventricosus]